MNVRDAVIGLTNSTSTEILRNIPNVHNVQRIQLEH